MPEPEIHPAPVLDLSPPILDKWQREKRAFYQMRDQLLTTHLGTCVAIHEGQVVDTDSDKIRLALRVYKKFGYVPIFVTRVTDKPARPIRIPSPRAVPRESPK